MKGGPPPLICRGPDIPVRVCMSENASAAAVRQRERWVIAMRAELPIFKDTSFSPEPDQLILTLTYSILSYIKNLAMCTVLDKLRLVMALVYGCSLNGLIASIILLICTSLWIKASAKLLNVKVNVHGGSLLEGGGEGNYLLMQTSNFQLQRWGMKLHPPTP